jgi:hypothetical protein
LLISLDCHFHDFIFQLKVYYQSYESLNPFHEVYWQLLQVIHLSQSTFQPFFELIAQVSGLQRLFRPERLKADYLYTGGFDLAQRMHI